MDQELKKQWVDALRSGKYSQCTGTLTDGEGYCCLGVLATIRGRLDDDGYCTDMCEDGDVDVPPEWVDARNPRLIHLNDTQGASFNEIADWIEANL